MSEREPGLDSTGLFPGKEEEFKEGYDFTEIVKYLKSIDETMKAMFVLQGGIID